MSVFWADSFFCTVWISEKLDLGTYGTNKLQVWDQQAGHGKMWDQQNWILTITGPNKSDTDEYGTNKSDMSTYGTNKLEVENMGLTNLTRENMRPTSWTEHK